MGEVGIMGHARSPNVLGVTSIFGAYLDAIRISMQEPIGGVGRYW